eukprot:TRINITY_DN1310_c0_g1_i1.p1 TRINITY_DN1310_c0_g1~~TRINITY_DN1310_c0_g1_i1.p1  ORF type:complete len:247 (-),score=59.45 TRINITY_DN1310_c0_g1_i1:234-974(-)
MGAGASGASSSPKHVPSPHAHTPLCDLEGDPYQSLLANNQEWVRRTTEEDPTYFARLAKGQQPRFLLIGCADSRAPPNELTQTHPGDLFIHRNVANLVMVSDANCMSVLQYAVEVLGVKDVIVMGHYGCGGIIAAMGRKSHGTMIDKWLGNIKDVYRLHRAELDDLSEEAKVKRLVELNVIEQVVNLRKTRIIQRAWSKGNTVKLHGWVYELATGIIHDLQVEKLPIWTQIDSIYTLKIQTHDTHI